MSPSPEQGFAVEVRHDLGSSGGVRTWGRGAPVHLRRPADGEPPASVALLCEQCHQELTYQVLSARGTRLWRWIWACWAVAGVVLVALTVLVAVSQDSGGIAVLLAIFVGAPGIGLTVWAANYGVAFIGMRGPGWLYRYPHHVVAWQPDRSAALVCDKCGHAEPLAYGDLRGARERMARHACGGVS